MRPAEEPRIAELFSPHPNLDPRQVALVALAACIAHSPEAAELSLARLAGDPAPAAERGEVLEIVLQSYLFAGFPRCINALAALDRHFPPPPKTDFEAEQAPPIHATDLGYWRRRGEELFERIYADKKERVLDDLRRFFPPLVDWILTEAYGKILARPAVDAATRELAACASLVVTGDLRQLSSHARGALRCGATPMEVRAAAALGAKLSPRDQSVSDEIVERTLQSID